MLKKTNVLFDRVSVSQFEVFFELIPVAIAVTTVDDGRFVYVNNNFEQLMDCSRKNILGKTSTELQIISIEKRIAFVKNFEEKSNQGSHRFVIKNFVGKKLNIIKSVVKTEIDNQLYFITTLTDVSEKLLANKVIKLLNNKVANHQKDKEHRKTALNTANIEILQYKKEKSRLGEDLQNANTELQNNDTEKNMREDEYIIKNNLHQEAQSLGQIGSWDWNLKTDQIYWTDEMYRIYGLPIQKQKIDISNSLMS
ncbi:MAG: Adaptive-response sensory-kinase SasA, partial [Bacteroidota bacterium]